MSEYTIGQFALDLQQDVLARSTSENDGEGEFEENVFTQFMIDYLGDAGEIDDGQVCPHRAHGIQVNGYALNDTEDCLDLVVTIFKGCSDPQTITKDEVQTAFKRVSTFFDKASSGFHFQVEESAAVFDLAQRIHAIKKELTQIRVYLVTDGIVKSSPPKSVDTASARITFSIWDLERLYRLVSSGRQREPIEIDFVDVLGYSIPCLCQDDVSPDYATYLAIFPGKAISDLYGRYGPRLLERNVRSFLQARGKVNSGIRQTILKEPHMFLAFNNGLSGTAEWIETISLPNGGVGIKSLKDLQIVNGGQTTASIYHAVKKEKNVEIEKIGVQVKLTVLKDAEAMDTIVPRISEYANTQNPVRTADLAANDAYHRRVEGLSREIWVPAKDGTARQTHWFYERARGQYNDEIVREGTPSRQAEFKAKNPKDQLFTKTDLGKFAQTWDQHPHIVSKGAQACFNDFMARLPEHMESEKALDTRYFERLVAKALIFRTAEKVIGKEIRSRSERLEGIRAQLVTYTIAKIIHDTSGRIDLGTIYRQQTVPESLESAIRDYWFRIYQKIFAAAQGGNFTQYCKREQCWFMVRDHDLPMPHGLLEQARQVSESPKEALVTTKGRNLSANAKKVVSIPAKEWLRLAEWGQKDRTLSGLDVHIVCEVASQIGYGDIPNERRCSDALRVLEKALGLGFVVEFGV